MILDELDFHGMTNDELTGKDGLLKQLTSRFYERILQAKMDEYLGYKKHTTIQGGVIPAIVTTGIVKDDNFRRQ